MCQIVSAVFIGISHLTTSLVVKCEKMDRVAQVSFSSPGVFFSVVLGVSVLC